MNKHDILGKPFMLHTTVAFESPYRLDATCGLDGEITYSVMDTQSGNGYEFHTRSMQSAIDYINEQLEREQ